MSLKANLRIGVTLKDNHQKNTPQVNKPGGDHERVSFRESMVGNIVGRELSEMTDDEEEKKKKDLKLIPMVDEPKNRTHYEPQSEINNDPHRLIEVAASSRISAGLRVPDDLRSRESIPPSSLTNGPSNRTAQSDTTAANSRGIFR